MIQKLKRNWLVILKLTQGTSQILTRALKSKKTFVLIGSLWPKYLLFELQKYRGVIFHDTEDLYPFWRKLTCSLKKDLRNLANSHQSTCKCQNLDFDEILLSKVEKLWPYNLQRSYMSWQWRIMKNLKRNWLVISKLTWGI